VPCAEDLLIHSITHLMHEGELHNGLRDLHDIDGMVRQFGGDRQFWTRLGTAALGNDLAVPVARGLALARQIFGSPVPEGRIQSLNASAAHGWAGSTLHRLYLSALTAPCERPPTAVSSLSLSVVYLRGHWLRMRPWPLTRHLATKAWKGIADARSR
jgi:hypothetical protein